MPTIDLEDQHASGKSMFTVDSEAYAIVLRNSGGRTSIPPPPPTAGGYTPIDVIWIHADPINNGCGIELRNQQGTPTIVINGDNGDISLLNADCAEDFEILPGEQVEPGAVMTINDAGQLSQCTQPYDKRVAGVIAGAGDLQPGLVLGRRMECANRLPISLLGRVLCKADASYASIEVGDLLTTSATIGHAMKANDSMKSFGAVLGKALQPLKKGCDLIPILVALQ
ncbi:MAG: hypothetical protein MUO26_10490 [Methanotrichaceae archaeon]|nr:hypothetical protein [Methanotrichaceae archaeon]